MNIQYNIKLHYFYSRHTDKIHSLSNIVLCLANNPNTICCQLKILFINNLMAMIVTIDHLTKFYHIPTQRTRFVLLNSSISILIKC